jgi:hypothetical protein
VKSFKEKIENRESGLLIYSFAPPKNNTEEQRLLTIANNQVERINSLNIDAVILYDIQDESHRTNEQRTFAFIPTISPEKYYRDYLSSLKAPKIIYKSIANQTHEKFADWLHTNSDLENVVFVGASSNKQIEETNFRLADAYELRRERFSHLLLGGVTIPERHSKTGDEHKRIFAKKQLGCSFFVSQCVYNVFEAKNLLSDYYYDSVDNNCQLNPIFFTLSPCGSPKTLAFMKWLGIEIPKWLYNELRHSKDILETSISTSIRIANEILEFSYAKSIPVGFNIESISNKKEEIEASTEILNIVSKQLASFR